MERKSRAGGAGEAGWAARGRAEPLRAASDFDVVMEVAMGRTPLTLSRAAETACTPGISKAAGGAVSAV